MRVLVADDDSHIRGAIRRLIVAAAPGAEIAHSESGAEALAALSAGDFDVVLLDISMPGMSGLEALKEIRGPLGRTLPVVIMTGAPHEAYEVAAMRAGASAFLRKDRISEELAALVTSLASRSSASALEVSK